MIEDPDDPYGFQLKESRVRRRMGRNVSEAVAIAAPRKRMGAVVEARRTTKDGKEMVAERASTVGLFRGNIVLVRELDSGKKVDQGVISAHGPPWRHHQGRRDLHARQIQVHPSRVIATFLGLAVIESKKMLAVVPYESRFNPRSGFHEFHHWELGEYACIRSKFPFERSSVLRVSRRSDSVVEGFKSGPESASDVSLMFMSSRIPLDERDAFSFKPYGCEILLQRPVSRGGNKNYIILAAVPLVGTCNIYAQSETSPVRDSFNFFISGGNVQIQG